MLRKSITAVVIAAFEMMITLDQWEGISKIITAAVVFWGMTMFLLIGMRKRMLKTIKENRKLRRENAELRKAIKEVLWDLNDTDLTNKSIVIMSASIRLERALKR